MRRIPYGRQDIDDADIAAVVDVLHSDWLTQGPVVERFEREFADRCGAPHASAVCNATAGLHLAYQALGLGPGDRVWTSPNTFVATANAARMCGADVDFVDIDARTFNLCPKALERKLRSTPEPLHPKIVVPVHFAGQPCDMDAIAQLARLFGFRIVEDASHAVGASFGGTPIGACDYSDLAVFSFHPVKIITTGEGGMVTTRDAELHRAVQRLRSHGVTRDPGEMTGAPDGDWYYEQSMLGFNYRITDIQAALGSSQLRRLGAFIARREALVARYDDALRGLPLRTPVLSGGRNSAWHLYVIQLDPAARLDRRSLFDALRARGILVNVHYIPVHTQPYYREDGIGPRSLPVAEAFYAAALSLPLFAGLTDADQDVVIGALRELLG
jgi:UDP-4-amino-4,6-dideoxy-N-acetyl-beta-L-altrosamine transaminase